MASPLFFDCLPRDFRFEAFFGIHFFQAPILDFKLLESGHHGGVHACVLGASLVKRGTAHAVLTAKLRHWRACFGLFEDRHDLAVRQS